MDNTIFNLSLLCYFRFPVIQDSVDRQVAIQGGIFKFDIYPDYKVIYPDYKVNKTGLELKLYWIPDQISKYKDGSQNND